VTLNGLRILRAEDAKYLGLQLDRRLNWKKHMLTEKRKAKSENNLNEIILVIEISS